MWHLSQIPKQFGNWEGEDRELDPRVFRKLDAEEVVNREYQDKARRTVAFHCAYFNKYDEGAFHNPSTCLRAAGYQKVTSEPMTLEVADQASVSVGFAIWEREGERVMVVHWYRLGEDVVLNRWQLGWARVKLAGSEKWPVLIKVLLQLPVEPEDWEDDKQRLQEFAGHAYQAIDNLCREPNSESPTE